MTLTRRELLTGIGGGTLAVGGLTALTGSTRDSRRFSQYTYAAPDDDTDDRRLRIAWYEKYNGVFVENHADTDDDLETTLDPDDGPGYAEEATFVTDASGPVISVGNVLPGDTGVLVVGLEVAEDFADPLGVWLRASVTEDRENGINEPERVAGDTTPDDGELDEVAVVEVWRDGSPFGSCNGRKEFDETLESPLVGPVPFVEAFDSTTDVGGSDGLLAFDCLDPGTLRCVALRWDVPDGTGNRAQGDSLGFEFSFAGGPCGGDSPFPVGGSR
ncbi:hypothetical protein EKH57_15745 [Halorubrum sp. BOL3-1]|uniref:hypothetical protein n=1 Tax=Halorubrum sp. BOL3-1 TaxID=2497325 RepID=UPI0010051546|nr:hypothetical protein [Halorubrum sp. BOL3-1]QAU14038.1 hypothetical protein EKH57_15745 [Halorubrum sp. BOL3-1]